MSAGFLTPAEVAESIARTGKVRCSLSVAQMLLLGLLAGVYIGFGAILFTMVSHDSAKYLGVGVTKLLGGSVFSLGLMLVVMCGAELFTGNCLIVSGVLTGDCTTGGMLRNWLWVYLANFAGSVFLAVLVYYSGLSKTSNNGLGASALSIAVAKVNLSWMEAFSRAIICNWLVCLAVCLATAARDVPGKVLGIYFPIMGFVAGGFEHSIANMYFIPLGLFLKSDAAVVAASNLTPEKLSSLTWSSFLLDNIVPVTLGNIIGGSFFVSVFYYLIYLRGRKQP